jgi:hypothetical protein
MYYLDNFKADNSFIALTMKSIAKISHIDNTISPEKRIA